MQPITWILQKKPEPTTSIMNWITKHTHQNQIIFGVRVLHVYVWASQPNTSASQHGTKYSVVNGKYRFVIYWTDTHTAALKTVVCHNCDNLKFKLKRSWNFWNVARRTQTSGLIFKQTHLQSPTKVWETVNCNILPF